MNNTMKTAKKITLVIGLLVTIILLGGCQITNNSNANGKPFDGNIDSARSYMLKLLEEKYGEEFQIVGDEDLTDYPAHGAVYDCYVAPTSDSNKVFSALVDQSKPNEVLDNFAMYFFKEEAETAVIALCENKEYITAYRIKFVTPATEKKWSSQDSLQAFLSENNSKVEIYACLEDSKTDKEYAEMIADFTEDIYSSSIDTTLKFVNNERYIFFQDFLVVGETKTPTLTNSEILASIDSAKQIRFKKQDDLIIKNKLTTTTGVLSSEEAMSLLSEMKIESNNHDGWGTEWSCVFNLSDFTVGLYRYGL